MFRTDFATALGRAGWVRLPGAVDDATRAGLPHPTALRWTAMALRVGLVTRGVGTASHPCRTFPSRSWTFRPTWLQRYGCRWRA